MAAKKAKKKPEPEEPVAEEQQLPPDELQELIQFARVHGLPILLGIVIAVGVISIVNLYRRRARLTAESASVMLGKAMQTPDVNTKVKQLDDVQAQYPTTPVAPLALMALAKARYDEGRMDIAVNKYLEFKSKYPDHPHAVGAELGRLHCLEEMRQTDTALKGFQAFLEDRGDHFLAPQAILGTARCLVTLGRTNEAREVCEDLIVARPDTAWSAKAEMLIEQAKRGPRPFRRPTVPQTIDISSPVLDPLMTTPGQTPLVLPPPPVAVTAATTTVTPKGAMPVEPAPPVKDVTDAGAQQ